MATLLKYFDRKPTQAFTLGPSGKGIAQTGFYDEWRAWYDKDVGISYVKEADYDYGNPTGYHASGSQDILFATSLSATFDSGAYLWASIHNYNTVNIFRYSGSNYTSEASFSGTWPALYYNVSNNRPERRYVYCFYLKSGENKIFSRTSQDNFGSEIVFHQDIDFDIQTLNLATRFDGHVNKMMLLGLDSYGDGFQLVSDCYYLFETGIFWNFSGMNTGQLSSFSAWECDNAENFTAQLDMTFDNFANYPSGTISYQFNSGSIMSGGYVWP
jgi:hypothetical protein